MSIQSNGQNGSNGAPGAHTRAICTNGLWTTKYPNIQMPFHFICDPHDSALNAGWYWGTPSGCENISQTSVDSDPLIPDPATGGDSQYAGPAGPQGKAGRVLLSRVTQMPECGPWSAALLDDGANAGQRTRFDVQSVFNRDCASCHESCKSDVNVTVCNQDTYTNPSVLGCCKDSSVLTDTCLGLNGNGGASGRSGGADLAFCLEPKYPYTDLSEYDVLGATSCRAKNLGHDGEYASTVPAWYTDAPLSVTIPRIHWAIAMRRLHPLELRRRLAVAHERFRQGERDAARLRYAEARFLLDANQRATDAGNGKPIDCNPDGSYAPDVKEVCGLRIELEQRAHYLDRGENYYGYSPRYAPPASLKAATLIGMAKDELKSARGAIDNWTLGLRLHYLDQDVVSTWSA